MNDREEKIAALLLDNRFVDWVVNPQSPYTEFWLQWIQETPDNASLAEEAKFFLLELRHAESDDTLEINETTTEEMFLTIRGEIDQETSPILPQRNFKPNWYWMAAAMVAGVLLVSGLLYVKKPVQPAFANEPTNETQLSSEVIRYNGSEKNELVFLPDGSKVTLAKGSRISYNRLLNGKKRNVTLTGEAFFDVAKNPEKPFYIYTQNMVIKVLGTSFRVIAYKGKQSVVVKSGKVSVYLKEQDLEQSAAKILLPKQVCTYSTQTRQLVTTEYPDSTTIEMETDTKNDYDFEDAPLETVLQALEKMYNLPFHYDRNVFKNCYITISLANESLEEKLEVITKTVEASYSISDYGIIITGKGCK